MKAVLVSRPGGPEVLTLGEAPTPTPGPGELLVRVRAAAVNRADTLQRLGKYPAPEGSSEILGMDIAGEVAELGAGCRRYSPGDRVFGLTGGGGYAEFATIPEPLALAIPDALEFTHAAAIPEVFMTAYQALVFLARMRMSDQPALPPENRERVLVHAGASGVGSAAIQIAQVGGAEVFATAGSAEKLKFCADLGARHAFNYRSDAFDERILDATEGSGVDIVVDFSGASLFSRNLAVLGEGGRLVILATLGGAEVSKLNLGLLMRKHIELIGSTLRSRNLAYRSKLASAFERDVLPRIADRSIAPVIDTVIDWSEAAEAHRRIEANATIGKIVLTGM